MPARSNAMAAMADFIEDGGGEAEAVVTPAEKASARKGGRKTSGFNIDHENAMPDPVPDMSDDLDLGGSDGDDENDYDIDDEPVDEEAEEESPEDGVDEEPAAEDEAHAPALEDDTELEALKQKAAAFDAFSEGFQSNPLDAMKAMVETLTDEQKLALGIRPEPEEPDMEMTTEEEKYLLDRLKKIEKAKPDNNLRKEMTEQFAQRNAWHNDRFTEQSIMSAKLDALMDFLDVKLPDFDKGAFEAALKKTGKIDKAVQEVFVPKVAKHITALKQSKVKRPASQKSSGAPAARPYVGGMSFGEALKLSRRGGGLG